MTAHTSTVVARILREISSDRCRGGERFDSKLRNSRRNGKVDLPFTQREVELDCINVSRLVLVPAAKGS